MRKGVVLQRVRYGFGAYRCRFRKDEKPCKTVDGIDDGYFLGHRYKADVLKSFLGEIEQVPPKFSALKVNGKKLYEYARAGQEIEIKSRKVRIKNIELTDLE